MLIICMYIYILYQLSDLNGFDTVRSNVIIKVFAGGELVGTASIPLKKIQISPDDYNRKL